MKVDFFYKGKPYGSIEAKEPPRVGALYCGKIIQQVTDFRFSNVLAGNKDEQEFPHPDFDCELGDP